MGARSAGNPHAACDVEGTGNVARSSGLPARQPSTLPMSGMWKRSHGGTIEAPPNERGGNGYVLPNATAPHLDSTPLRHADCVEQCPSSRAKRKTCARTEFFPVWRDVVWRGDQSEEMASKSRPQAVAI